MNQSKLSHPLVCLGFLICLGSLWGTGYSIARFAMTNGVHPFGYSFWQSLGPAILVSLIAFFRNDLPQMTPSHLRYYFVSGLAGIVIPNSSMYFAASHLPAGVMAMIVNTVPVIAYPLALLVGIETFNWQRLTGIFLAFCGLMLIVLPKTSLPDPHMVRWVLPTLITPLSFAFCSIYIARYRPTDSSSLSLTSGMLLASSILLIPLVMTTHSFYQFHLPFTAPDWIILLEILLSSVGYLLFFQLIKIAGPVYYSLVDTIVVLTGLFWGYIIFGEHLNKWTGTAVCLILFALLLVTQQQKRAKQNLVLVPNESIATL